jgi:hypothetical protein
MDTTFTTRIQRTGEGAHGFQGAFLYNICLVYPAAFLSQRSSFITPRFLCQAVLPISAWSIAFFVI